MMERLTDETGQLYACGNDLCDFEPKQMCSDCKYQYEANKKLFDYETAEEEGRLVVLPCKVGEIVYRIKSVFGTVEINEEEFDLSHYYLNERRLYNDVFLTRAEAESALKAGATK